jgi:hypothetical protein
MKSYLVITKSSAEITVTAYDYTEDGKDGRVYFHKAKDKSDRKNFFVTGWVAAIVEIENHDKPNEPRKSVRKARK